MAVLITANEVCDKLKIKLNHLYQLNYRNQLKPAEKKGNKLFYSVEEVDNYAKQRTAKNS